MIDLTSPTAFGSQESAPDYECINYLPLCLGYRRLLAKTSSLLARSSCHAATVSAQCSQRRIMDSLEACINGPGLSFCQSVLSSNNLNAGPTPDPERSFYLAPSRQAREAYQMPACWHERYHQSQFVASPYSICLSKYERAGEEYKISVSSFLCSCSTIFTFLRYPTKSLP